jgi:TonB-linked SusC/RagA family outer membrane protein
MQLQRVWSARQHARSTLVAFAMLALPLAARAQSATITGLVTAATSNAPLGEARVMVVGSSLTVLTGADGRYTMRNAPVGTYEVRVIRVGYQELKKPVTVTAGGSATLNFTMNAAIVQLQEIVTTATGQQRRVEIGNSVTTLGDVAAKVETQPVTNISDLLVGKSPGVAVVPGAMTGAAPNIRIRGIGSLATTGSGITNNPIYVIDGVRVVQNNVSFGFTGTNASLLNDVNPNEIEDVEIVKGPSAATLYGTDAANGVIVITTRKGRAGTSRWTWWGEGGAVDDRNKYPTDYASWGHDATGKVIRCTLVTEAAGTCSLDSLTSFSVMNDPNTTAIKLGNRGAGGMNVSGGSEAVRFFVSGDLQNEVGPITMPNFAKATLDTMGVALRDEWVHPEQFQSYSARANLNATISPKVDLAINTGFSNTNQRLPQVDNNTQSFIFSALNNPGFNHNGLGYNEVGSLGEFKNGYGSFQPAQIFQHLRTNGTQRFIGSADMTWRPLAWMQNQGTIGVDLADNDNLDLCRFGECPNTGTVRQGQSTDQKTNFRNFSAKLVSNSTWQAKQWLNVKTTVGADYTNQEVDQVTAASQNLPPGAQTVGAGATPTTTANQLQTVNKTLGLYVQEQASFRDRMFITGALRTDQNSSFGSQFQQVVYPKASISWIMSDESFFPKYSWMDQFRVRAAYGASGVQPGGTVALQTFTAVTTNAAVANPGATGGVDTPGLAQNALGNPDLKPERSSEFEGGFETNLLGSRAHLDVTYYNKHTRDGLVSLPIAGSSGAAATSVLANLAQTSNSGYEVTLNTTLINRRALGWDVTIGASHNSQRVISLGNDLAGKPVGTIISGSTRDSIGLPINAWVLHPYHYSDTNGDGIIAPAEVTVDTGVAYYGYSQPRDIVSITNGFDLFNRHLRLTVLTDYKGGYGLFNNTNSFYATNFATWYSENLKSTPLWDQARNVAASSAKTPTTNAGYIENGQFWKLREVSAALTMPDRFATMLRARDMQLVFTARNLHTWTSYTGTDPEANYSTGDVLTDFSTTAPRTYFTVRANLHY